MSLFPGHSIGVREKIRAMPSVRVWGKKHVRCNKCADWASSKRSFTCRNLKSSTLSHKFRRRRKRHKHRRRCWRHNKRHSDVSRFSSCPQFSTAPNINWRWESWSKICRLILALQWADEKPNLVTSGPASWKKILKELYWRKKIKEAFHWNTSL